MESNLLKEAIADAKAVRQTALANAKVALEEAFEQKYNMMFAEKLKEDAEEGMGQPQPANGTTPADDAAVSKNEIDELIAELEAESGQGEVPPSEPNIDASAPQGMPPMGGAPAPSPMGAPPVPGAPAAGCPPCPPCPPPMPAAPGMAPVPSVGGEMPPMGGAPAPSPMGGEMPPATPPSDAPPASGESDDEVSLDELLESLKDEIEGNEKEEKEEETLDEQKKLASSAIGGKAGGSDNKKPSSSANATSGIETGGMKQQGIPSPDKTKVGPSDATKATRPNSDGGFENTPSLGGSSGPALKASRPNSKGDFENTATLQEQNVALKKQLNEHEDVIRYVKTQLNEVNLLNAKLLYTNKLFKEYGMSNEHKMRVVEMFDLAKNVREVKLTYANITESLKFGGNEMKKKVVATTNTSVQSITESLSSKPVGSTKPKEIISEGKFASRMKQLAGIRSEPKK